MARTESQAGIQRTGLGAGSIAGGSARLLLARMSSAAASFVSALILARALPPSERGAVAFVTMAALVLAGISGLGLEQATVVFAAKRIRDRPNLLTNLCLLSLTTAMLLGGACAVGLAIASSVRPTDVGGVELLCLVLGTVGLRLNSASVAFLLGCGRFRAQSIVVCASPVLLAVLLLVAWPVSDLTVRSACLIWTAAQLGGAAVGLVAAAYVDKWGLPSPALAREAATFGLRAWGLSIALSFNARIDQVIMGLISTEAALGYYAVAVNAGEAALYPLMTVAQVATPSIARGSMTESIETTLRLFRALLLLTAGIVAVGFVCSPLIPIVFGSDYRPSVEPFLWLLPGGLAYVALNVFSSSLLATSAPGRSSLGPSAALVVGVALDFVLIPPLGATGAAIAASAASVAGGLVATFFYIRLTRIDTALLLPRRGDLAFLRALAWRFTGR